MEQVTVDEPDGAYERSGCSTPGPGWPFTGPGQRDMKRRADAGLALDPDPAAVGLGDLLADGQASAGSFVFLAGVQAFGKSRKDLVVEFGARSRSRCRERTT